MALDLQPVAKSLDLQPVIKPLDLKPVPSTKASGKMNPQEQAKVINELYDNPKPLDFTAPKKLDLQPTGKKLDLQPVTATKKGPEELLPDDPNKEYGAILPISKDTVTGKREIAVPGMVRNAIHNFELPGKVTAGTATEDEITRGAPSLALSAALPIIGGAAEKSATKVAEDIKSLPVKAEAPPMPGQKSPIFTPDTPVATTKEMNTPRGVADRLYANKQRATADQHELLTWVQKNAANIPEETWERINDHLDDPEHYALASPDEHKALQVVHTLRSERDAINAEIAAKGFKPESLEHPDEAADAVGGATRQVKGKNTPMDRLLGTQEKQSLKEKIAGALSSPVGKRNLSKTAGSLKSRSMQAITDEEGKRTAVYTDKKGQVFDAAKPDQPIGLKNPDGSISMENGKPVKLGEATQKEIEQATAGRIQYHKNALGVEATSLLQSRRALRNVQIFDEIMHHPEAESVVQDAADAPKDWKRVEGFPNEDKYKFEPRFAEEIEDFLGGMNKNMSELGVLQALNRFTIGAFFWLNPAHIYNVAEAFAVSKGAIGSLLDAPGTAGDFLKSMRSVATRDKFYMQQMRSGVPLRGMDTMTEKFDRGLLNAMQYRAEQDPKGFAAFAKAFGMKPIELIKRVGELSHDATFSFQDMLQQTLERGLARKGIGQAEATEQIAKTLPSYRTPARVAGSRVLGKAMKGSAWFQFPGWDVGRLQGLGNILKGSAKLDKKSLDQLLMIGVLYEFGKQVADPLVQELTGNKKAEAPTAGYGVFPRHMEKVATGQETLGQAEQSLFPFGYVPRAGELVSGTDLYTGKHLSLPGEKPGEGAYDYAKHAADQVDPLRRLLEIQSGKQTPREAALSQIGVKDPSPKEQASKNKAIRYNRQQLKAKRKKEPDFVK